MAMEGSSTSATFACSSPLAAPDHEHDEYNMWNPMLGLFGRVDIGALMEAIF